MKLIIPNLLHRIKNLNCSPLKYVKHQIISEQKVISGNAVNFGPISNAINAIGNFEYNNHLYYPRVPNDRNVPKAHLVTYSNLHQIILHKESMVTELLIRSEHQRLFYEGTKLLLFILNQKYWLINKCHAAN